MTWAPIPAKKREDVMNCRICHSREASVTYVALLQLMYEVARPLQLLKQAARKHCAAQ